MADHVARQHIDRGLRDKAGGNHIAVSQHCVACADLHDLAQLMRNEHNAYAALSQRIHHIEHTANFRLRKRSGRLVHDDDGSLHQKCAGNLDNLLIGSIEVAHHDTRVEVKIHFFENFVRFRNHRGGIQKTVLLPQLVADKHILVNGKIIYKV